MRRFLLLIVLVMVVSWIVASHRSALRRPASPMGYWASEGRGRQSAPGRDRIAVEARRKNRHVLGASGAHVRKALDETDAKSTVTGLLSATRVRAVADARRIMRDNVASWLDPEVPRGWSPPERLLDDMVVDKPQVKEIKKRYGEMFEATLTVDTSPQRRTSLIEVYNHQLVERRLATLGATLAFILICLAAISGYIRADEATKGYYTNRLRLLAAAGVGASGVIIYHMVV